MSEDLAAAAGPGVLVAPRIPGHPGVAMAGLPPDAIACASLVPAPGLVQSGC